MSGWGGRWGSLPGSLDAQYKEYESEQRFARIEKVMEGRRGHSIPKDEPVADAQDDAAEMRRRQEVVAETATIRPAETRDGFIVSWNSVDLFVPRTALAEMPLDAFWPPKEGKAR